MSQEKSARVVWTGEDLNFTAVVGSGYSFGVSAGDGEKGASPMELILVGVAGCTAVDVVGILKKQRQDVFGIEVEAVGVRAAEHPKVYTDVTLTYVVRGTAVDPRAVERAIALSEEKYCSASAMLSRSGTNLKTQYRIEEV